MIIGWAPPSTEASRALVREKADIASAFEKLPASCTPHGAVGASAAISVPPRRFSATVIFSQLSEEPE